MIREANKNDLDEILQLYLYLHEKSIPEDSQHLRSTWDNIINDVNHHLIVCEIDGRIVSSCVCSGLRLWQQIAKIKKNCKNICLMLIEFC